MLVLILPGILLFVISGIEAQCDDNKKLSCTSNCPSTNKVQTWIYSYDKQMWNHICCQVCDPTGTRSCPPDSDCTYSMRTCEDVDSWLPMHEFKVNSNHYCHGDECAEVTCT